MQQPTVYGDNYMRLSTGDTWRRCEGLRPSIKLPPVARSSSLNANSCYFEITVPGGLISLAVTECIGSDQSTRCLETSACAGGRIRVWLQARWATFGKQTRLSP